MIKLEKRYYQFGNLADSFPIGKLNGFKELRELDNLYKTKGLSVSAHIADTRMAVRRKMWGLDYFNDK